MPYRKSVDKTLKSSLWAMADLQCHTFTTRHDVIKLSSQESL